MSQAPVPVGSAALFFIANVRLFARCCATPPVRSKKGAGYLHARVLRDRL